MHGELDDWRDRSADLPARELPTDRPYTPNRLARTDTVAVVGFGVPATTAQRLRTLADEHGTTLPRTLLAAFMALIGRYTGSDNVAVVAGVADAAATPAARRSGLTLQRADLSGAPSFAELLERIRQGEADRDPLSEETLTALAAERAGWRSALFQLCFRYASPESEGYRLAGELEAEFDLAVRVGDSGEGLAGEVRYRTALFDAATVQRLAGHLVAVLEAVAADAGQRVDEVSVPAEGEFERLVAGGDRGRSALSAADGQVKVRGFPIEPGEIEAVLTSHPQIRSAVVAAVGDAEDRRLVAYLVPADRTDGVPPVGELRAYAARWLPAFVIPLTFVELAALPLTPNGKLDRTALPEPDGERPQLEEFVAPSGDAEEAVARLWAEVLGVDRIGATDNFFELGGHSLLATRVTSRIRDAFELEIPVSALFDHPTVRGLAAVVEELIWYEIDHMPEDEVVQSLDSYAQGAESDENGVR